MVRTRKRIGLSLFIALGRGTLAPALLALAFLTAGFCALLEELAGRERPPERRALRRAVCAISNEEHLRPPEDHLAGSPLCT